MRLAQLPSEVLGVLREFRTCEFSTVNRGGYPVTWPTLPFLDMANNQVIVTTSIGLPEKVYNVRRNGRVALFFSDPTASGLQKPPAVLIQGDAIAPDEISTEVAGVEELLAEVFRRQPDSGFYSANAFTRWLFDWYYMRLMILVTPRRVLWWQGGDLELQPQRLEGTEDVA
jgi:hypothetical protein